MTRFNVLALVLALAACSPAPAPHANASINPAADAAETGESAKAGPTIPSSYLLGRWGDSGDCNKDIVFNADGTFRSYTGGGGQWSIAEDIITMSGDGGVFQLRARVIDARTIELTNPDGSVFTSQRC